MLSKKDLVLSLPVSRVGLSTRLNQLGQPILRPSTPATYVSSSLNPNRNAPMVHGMAPGLKMASPDDFRKFEELPMVKSIRQFEATLAGLAGAVSSFRDEEISPAVHQLIDISLSISQAVSKLEEHQRLLLHVKRLEADNNELDEHLNYTLRKLISIRASLRQVPDRTAQKLNTVAQDLQAVDIQTLLDYSMKLAKFSKAPVAVLSQMVHPNNYIWPAEDALRRGMLAMASLNQDELIRAEIGDEEDIADENKHLEPAESVGGPDLMPKALSVEKVTPQPRKVLQQQPAANLDLDLFDPEDDSDENAGD